MIEDRKDYLNIFWFVRGDINEVLYNFKKKGGAVREQNLLDGFREILRGCDLWDLDFIGYVYIWWNGREVGHNIEERSDCFFVNTEWLSLFLNVTVEYMDVDLSDYMFIFFRLKFRQCYRRIGKKRFYFENMWVLEEGCEKIIVEVW